MLFQRLQDQLLCNSNLGAVLIALSRTTSRKWCATCAIRCGRIWIKTQRTLHVSPMKKSLISTGTTLYVIAGGWFYIKFNTNFTEKIIRYIFRSRKQSFIDDSFKPGNHSLYYYPSETNLPHVVKWKRVKDITVDDGPEADLPWTVFRRPHISDISQG